MSTYTLGQVVGILRTGSWNTVAEGKYTVTKVNKVRVEFTREGGTHARTFSVKTGRELSEFASSNTYVVSEDRYDLEIAGKKAQAKRERAVEDIKSFANKLGRYGVSPDELTIMRALLDEAEKFALVA
jgi:phage protein U